jgi:hypothetical protein
VKFATLHGGGSGFISPEYAPPFFGRHGEWIVKSLSDGAMLQMIGLMMTQQTTLDAGGPFLSKILSRLEESRDNKIMEDIMREPVYMPEYVGQIDRKMTISLTISVTNILNVEMFRKSLSRFKTAVPLTAYCFALE